MLSCVSFEPSRWPPVSDRCGLHRSRNSASCGAKAQLGITAIPLTTALERMPLAAAVRLGSQGLMHLLPAPQQACTPAAPQGEKGS